MKNTPPRTINLPVVLSGWKDIANYLGRGVRTVQRYEREMKLPVHHPAGHLKGAVIATKAELDAWVDASPFREALSLRPDTAARGLRTALAEQRVLIKELRELRDETQQLRATMEERLDLLRRNLDFAIKGIPPSSERHGLAIVPTKKVQ